MQIQLIRNATMRFTYAGRLFLTDPFLAPKHSLRSFAGQSPNPLMDLPYPPKDILAGVEMVIISHLHTDHFDPDTQKLLSKDIPIFCQPGDETEIGEQGFRQVTPVEHSVDWRGITITRTPGQHGTGLLAEQMGKVSGFLFRAQNEPAVYWAGDTIWYEAVKSVVAEEQPDIIITHSSGAKFDESDPIVMDTTQTVAVCRAAPQAVVVAVHMDALDHGTVTRSSLRAAAEAHDIGPNRLRIPADGETIPL